MRPGATPPGHRRSEGTKGSGDKLKCRTGRTRERVCLGVSLHDKSGGNSLSHAAGICLIAAGMMGTGWLLFGAASGDQAGRRLAAQRMDGEEEGLPLSAVQARDNVPALVAILETASETGSASLEDPEAVEDAIGYLQQQGRTNGAPSTSGALPQDGRVLWEQDVIRLTVVSP